MAHPFVHMQMFESDGSCEIQVQGDRDLVEKLGHLSPLIYCKLRNSAFSAAM